MTAQSPTLSDSIMQFEFMKRRIPSTPFAIFGLETPGGWDHILWTLCGEIDKYLRPTEEVVKFTTSAELVKRNFVRDAFNVTQIKEKFGGLRFYTASSDKFINDLIRVAQSISYYTCAVCGESGRLRALSWQQTLCKKHFWLELWNEDWRDRLGLIWDWLIS